MVGRARFGGFGVQTWSSSVRCDSIIDLDFLDGRVESELFAVSYMELLEKNVIDADRLTYYDNNLG